MIRFALKNTKKSALTLIGVAALSLTMAGPAFAADGNAEVNVTPGDLTISNVTATSFDDGVGLAGVKLTGADVDASADLDFTITDARGSGLGYSVTVKATQFKTTSDVILGSNLLTISNVVATQDGDTTSAAPQTVAANGSLDNTDGTEGAAAAITILNAPANTGMGTYIVNDADLSLTIPASAKADTYTSVLTIDTANVIEE